ncbi:LLM class flavin-dependent oxidoreductase [Paenibacillus arenilitoris]|uniref:LLM class flavin-dependent oxidoreductase n=1 Tax=Paenibacillus arenilitoris TaxID=2772299 RepID=A0A927CP86_9BACL|nr:LLM class flavin-dependent oxidoreductase [Paenibacillus arenilitoris]MBD2870547.1 LLM class flavin-dependent oxidoreductase [Paenibacillus arenilitoris]
MGDKRKQLHLNLFLMSTGHHEASWRHPNSAPERAVDVNYYVKLARTAERGKLDSLFLADSYGLPPTIKYKVLQGLEPFTLLSALAMATERIGLIGTASTTYNEPFHVARKFASLDLISGGRAGWNIVTSTGNTTAFNFRDEELPDHSDRYRRAEEFLQVVKSLWDSWEDEALVIDKQSGIYADPDKIKPISHKGDYYAVRGPLNLPRTPQGHPLLVQAGASETGKEFAAMAAEAVFTAQNNIEGGRRFYSDLKSRLAKYGRTPEEACILPGFCPIIGDTEAEAREKEQALHELTQIDYGLYRLSNLFGINLAGYPLDGPLPYADLPQTEQINSQKGRHQMFIEMARTEGLTIRQLMMRTASSRGHFSLAGTPVQIADAMERWFAEGAADGFNLMPPYLPDGLDDFVDKVVPELQNRGLFREEYTGGTLREHYGRPLPSRALLSAQLKA